VIGKVAQKEWTDRLRRRHAAVFAGAMSEAGARLTFVSSVGRGSIAFHSGTANPHSLAAGTAVARFDAAPTVSA
jgi:hypothetical protein